MTTEYFDEAPPAPKRRLSFDPRTTGGEEAYRAATRHSRMVRWLKYILPALAVGGVALFFGTARFIPSDIATLVNLAGIDPTANTVVMDKPHISGFEGTRRAYEVKADSAAQSLDNPKIVTFTKIDARIGLDDAGTATIGAATGVYDGTANTLKLGDGMSVETTNGYSATFLEAVVDLAKGSLISNRPIEIRSREGMIRANAMEVSERGKKIAFRDGVSVTYMPIGELAAPAAVAGTSGPEAKAQ